MSRMRMGITLALMLTGTASLRAANHNWELGHGFSAAYLENSLQVISELDIARWDWVLVEVHGQQNVPAMNRLLEINPRLKFLIRLWPINGLGVPGRMAGAATFLEYTLKPETQAEIDRRLRVAIRELRENISNWDNVVGFEFVEEIPGWWGCAHEIVSCTEPGGKIPEHLAHYKAELEQLLGKPLVWDAGTKWWVGKQCAATLERIHRLIKQESGGKLVFYHHQVGFATLDEVGETLPADFDVVKWAGYPFYFRDIIKPGVCDGFMAYPNGPVVWNNKYMRHVTKNGWLFFSQLSHQSFMRMSSWADTEAMVMARSLQNLGYFFFCTGDCAAAGVWNDDPAIPRDPAWNQRDVSTALHMRKHCAKWNIGMDVVRRHQHLQVRLDTKLDNLKAGDVFPLVAVIENPKDPSFYRSPEEAVARQVRVKAILPPGIVAEAKYSPPVELAIGDIPAQGRKSITWWLTLKDPKALQGRQALVVSATSANTDPGRAETRESVALPSLEPHVLRSSGEKWTENGFRYGGQRLTVEIVALGEPIKNPAVSDGIHTVTYRGEIWAGMRLVITGNLKARLYPANLLEGVEQAWTDPTDPSGYRAFSEGYQVGGAYLVKYLRAGAKYRLTISGKAEGGANSLVALRTGRREGEAWMPALLANAFAETWREASAELTVPDDIHVLERLYLYRFNNKGTIWYGPLSLVPADLPAEGKDVSEGVSGQAVVIPWGTVGEFTYLDESPAAGTGKVRVKLSLPE